MRPRSSVVAVVRKLASKLNLRGMWGLRDGCVARR
jgi:hypothetical protein